MMSKGAASLRGEALSEAEIHRRMAEARAGGTCALCNALCGSGSYCIGCGAFVCWGHGERTGLGDAAGKTNVPHTPLDHQGGW